MGSCTSCVLNKFEQEHEEITRKFDSFDFRINPTDEFTFVERARRELAGSCAPDDFMARLFRGYREFIIEAATEILVSKKTPENGKFICTLTPPPLVDEMWCLAILYTKKYKELCEYLVGGIIDRVPTTKIRGFRNFMKIWPDYSQDFWEIDHKFIVWIYNKDIREFFNLFYDKVYGLQKHKKICLLKRILNITEKCYLK